MKKYLLLSLGVMVLVASLVVVQEAFARVDAGGGAGTSKTITTPGCTLGIKNTVVVGRYPNFWSEKGFYNESKRCFYSAANKKNIYGSPGHTKLTESQVLSHLERSGQNYTAYAVGAGRYEVWKINDTNRWVKVVAGVKTKNLRKTSLKHLKAVGHQHSARYNPKIKLSLAEKKSTSVKISYSTDSRHDGGASALRFSQANFVINPTVSARGSVYVKESNGILEYNNLKPGTKYTVYFAATYVGSGNGWSDSEVFKKKYSFTTAKDSGVSKTDQPTGTSKTTPTVEDPANKTVKTVPAKTVKKSTTPAQKLKNLKLMFF